MTIPPAWIDQAALEAAKEIERETMDYWPVERRVAYAQSIIVKAMMQAATRPSGPLSKGADFRTWWERGLSVPRPHLSTLPPQKTGD
jgi:hypothetical protein